MKTLRTSLAILVYLGTFCCYGQTLKNYDLLVDNDAEFDFLFSRADSTATGAVIAGLIGAGIEEGVRSSEDREKLRQILPHISDNSCSNKLVSSLTSKMDKKGVSFNLVNSQKESKRESALIELEIKDCGFKLVDTQKRLVAPFIRLGMRVRQAGQKKFAFDEIIYITGKKQQDYSSWLGSPESFDSEFQKALKKAGRRIANKIIYGEF